MKKANLTLLLFFLLTTFCFAQEKSPNPVLGMWELGPSVYNDQNTTNQQFAQLKLYRADNTFQAYIAVPGNGRSVQTMEGTYTFKNDSVYTETILKATTPELIGDIYDIVYQREDDQLRLKGSVEVNDRAGNQRRVHYNETWLMVDFPEKQ